MRLFENLNGALAAAVVALLLEALRRRAADVSVIERLLAVNADVLHLRGVLRRAFADPDLDRAVRRPDGLAWLESAAPTVRQDRIELPIVTDAGNAVGAVATDGSAQNDLARARVVLSAAAIVLDNARLHDELVARLDEVRQSRTRIVEAGLAERRRVERDLHDGAQQHLLAVAASLGRLELVDTASGADNRRMLAVLTYLQQV